MSCFALEHSRCACVCYAHTVKMTLLYYYFPRCFVIKSLYVSASLLHGLLGLLGYVLRNSQAIAYKSTDPVSVKKIAYLFKKYTLFIYFNRGYTQNV